MMKYVGNMKKYGGNMKGCEGNMKEYDGTCGKYEGIHGNMKEYLLLLDSGTWKNSEISPSVKALGFIKSSLPLYRLWDFEKF